MIRTLLLAVAVLATVFALTQDNLAIYIAVAVFVVIVLALFAGSLFRRRRAAADEDDAPVVPKRSELTPERELASLGIQGPPRPRDTVARSVPDPEEPDGALAPKPVVPPPSPSADGAKAPGARARRPFRDEDLTPDEAARAAQEHLLNALLLGTDAHTVALLRQEDGTPLRYHIERIVSRNAYARPHGAFVARAPFVPPGERRAVLYRMGQNLTADAVKYYREPITALRAVLAVALRVNDAPHVLLADAMQDGRLDTARARTLIETTARLLEGARPDATAAPLATGMPAEAPARPTRREVIAEEMEHAGQAGIALALVHVEPAEPTGDGLAAAEAALEDELRALTPDGRVEPFGELTYGVFLRDAGAAVEAWTDTAHARLRDRYPGGHVSIGVACHTPDGGALSPEAFREYATKALEEAYEAGEPVIFE